MSEGALSPLRRLKLFFPPIESPLLTTYGKANLPKMQSLKEKFSVLSQRKETSNKDDVEDTYMSSMDIDIVNSSYLKIKRSRG